MKKLFWLLLVGLCLTPHLTQAEVVLNAGLVEGLWFSNTPVFAETPTRLYAALFNNTGSDLSGKLTFFDNGQPFHTSEVQVLDGRLAETWADWFPLYGEHELSATLSQIVLHDLSGTRTSIATSSTLKRLTLFVDFDTDGDGIGNKIDNDDDGDSVSDETELTDGTDPLDPESTRPARDKSTETLKDELAEVDIAIDPEGLEQFLSENRLKRTLSDLTEIINNTRDGLLDHKQQRRGFLVAPPDTDRESRAGSSTPLDLITNNNNFGTLTQKLEEHEPPWLDKIASWFKQAISSGYTLTLAGLIGYLSHPILVQLTLLLLILIGLFWVARRFGRRHY